MTTLVISYYNLGVELEHIQELEKATDSYQKAYKVAVKDLGKDHPLTV